MAIFFTTDHKQDYTSYKLWGCKYLRTEKDHNCRIYRKPGKPCFLSVKKIMNDVKCCSLLLHARVQKPQCHPSSIWNGPMGFPFLGHKNPKEEKRYKLQFRRRISWTRVLPGQKHMCWFVAFLCDILQIIYFFCPQTYVHWINGLMSELGCWG